MVRMYFINQIPFTFDELTDEEMSDPKIIKECNKSLSWEPEELFVKCFYLIDEEVHPLLFEVEVDNPKLIQNLS